MFNTKPVNRIRSARLKRGFIAGYGEILEELCKKADAFSQYDCIVIAVDGTNGAEFSKITEAIEKYYSSVGYTSRIIDINIFLKPQRELEALFDNNITGNRAFGYVREGSIEDYFQSGARDSFKSILDSCIGCTGAKTVIIIRGTGAFYVSGGGCQISVYLDVSREYQEIMHKRGLPNFAVDISSDAVEKYKVAYFVEWPILERYRRENLDCFDLYIDMNDMDRPIAATPTDIAIAVGDIAKFPFRVKPFFMPGVWGGQFLKRLAHLPEEMKNCAWNFEPIAPENSILIEYQKRVMEVPFLIVMEHVYELVLGKRITALFGSYFPIRFDYLDTMDGGNLSCQVHPGQKYIREKFNDFLEQQESYYIMEQQGGSAVYLGLTEDCSREAFYNAVAGSVEKCQPLDINEYVNSWPSRKGDLFLIPPGTVHCSGKDNLVLEISSTTWWYTFKIYDYLRKDLDGKPRPLNIEYAFDCIDFERKTGWVKENLIPAPCILEEQGKNSEYLLGQRDDLLFRVRRIHLEDTWKDDTNGEFLILNLVEGEKIGIVSGNGDSDRDDNRYDDGYDDENSCSAADEGGDEDQYEYENGDAVHIVLEYAEACIIPAAYGSFRIINLGNKPCKLIKATVSPDWRVKLCE